MQKHRPKLGVGFVLGLCVLAGLISAAAAALTIKSAAAQHVVFGRHHKEDPTLIQPSQIGPSQKGLVKDDFV